MVPINFTPFPNLTTERLTLRQLEIQDADELFALRSDEGVLKFLDRPKAASIDDAIQFIEKINNAIKKDESVYWAISLKNNHKLIGTICYWNISEDNSTADIGYELQPFYQGKGIMQEAVVKVISYGFETMKLNSINADLHPDNSPSVKLLERNGFVLTGKSENTVIYSLKKKDFSEHSLP